MALSKAARGIKVTLDTLFTKHLFATNVITCGALLGCGDCLIQRLEMSFDKDKKYHFERTGRMMVIGFCLGPFNHFWYSWLDRFLKGNSKNIVFKKIACDQAVAGPFFCISFLAGMSLLEGKGVEGAIKECKEKFLPIYKIDWAFWPAAQFINFRFLPPRFRVAYVCSATLIWNSILSYMKHNYNVGHDEECR